MKTRSFFFHYNKPASLASGTPKLSVHYNRKCMIVDHIVCNVHTYSNHRRTQPRCVIRGKAHQVALSESPRGITAYIL